MQKMNTVPVPVPHSSEAAQGSGREHCSNRSAASTIINAICFDTKRGGGGGDGIDLLFLFLLLSFVFLFSFPPLVCDAGYFAFTVLYLVVVAYFFVFCLCFPIFLFGFGYFAFAFLHFVITIHNLLG